MREPQLSDVGFGIGRVISQTAGVIGRNFVPILLLCVLIFGIETAVVTGTQQAEFRLPQNLRIGTVLLSGNLLAIIARGFLVPALTRLTFEDLNGRRIGFGAALRSSVSIALPIILLEIVMYLGIALGFILLIVPGVILVLRWFVAAQVRSVEGPGLLNALRRSAALTAGYRWKLLGLSLVVTVMLAAAFGIPASMAAVVHPSIVIGGFDLWPTLQQFVLGSVMGGIVTVVTAVTYTELRRVSEGGLSTDLAAVFE